MISRRKLEEREFSESGRERGQTNSEQSHSKTIESSYDLCIPPVSSAAEVGRREGGTHDHPRHTEHTAPYESLRIAYPSLQKIWPSNLGYQGGCDVAECDDSFRCRWRDEVQSGG